MIALTFWRDGLSRWFQTALPSPWGGPAAIDQSEDDSALLGEAPHNAGTDERQTQARPTSGVEPMLHSLTGPTSRSFAAIIMNAPAATRGEQGFGHLELAHPLDDVARRPPDLEPEPADELVHPSQAGVIESDAEPLGAVEAAVSVCQDLAAQVQRVAGVHMDQDRVDVLKIRLPQLLEVLDGNIGDRR